MISSDSQSCDPSKLQRVESSLRRTYIILGDNTESSFAKRTNEYDALRHIVQKHMKDLTDEQLMYTGESIEDFVMSQAKDSFDYPSEYDTKLEINEQCKGVSISSTEYVILDPYTGSLITYGNLKSWFGTEEYSYKTKTNKGKNITKQISLNDPCNILARGFKRYKTEYPLPSPMWRLQAEELKGVRTRFMKLLSFLLLSLEKMYEDVKSRNTKNFEDGEMKQAKEFYKNLLKSIKLESDSEKKKKLIDLKNSVEAKFGNGLKNFFDLKNLKNSPNANLAQS
jgi:hypothetical protein